MKGTFKTTILLCLTICILLLTVACKKENEPVETTTAQETTTPEETSPEELTEEDLYPEPIKQLLAENKPYSLEFVSNGDGTCYVSKLYLNNQYQTAFDIVIPEKSPAGDVVTGIQWGDSLTPTQDVLPMYLTEKQLEEIEKKVLADYPEVKQVDKWWVNAYQIYDVSKMPPMMRQEMVKRYPVLEYIMISSFLPKMSNICDSFSRAEMVGFTPTVTKQYYEEFMQEAREAGAPEEILTPFKELIEALPVYVNHSKYVRYLHIPSSVTSIEAEALSYLLIEDTYDDKSLEKGVILPVLDLKTTKEIRRNLIGIIFSQSTTEDGYEDIDNFAVHSPEKPQDDILAWHYVDGGPTLWE